MPREAEEQSQGWQNIPNWGKICPQRSGYCSSRVDPNFTGQFLMKQEQPLHHSLDHNIQSINVPNLNPNLMRMLKKDSLEVYTLIYEQQNVIFKQKRLLESASQEVCRLRKTAQDCFGENKRRRDHNENVPPLVHLIEKPRYSTISSHLTSALSVSSTSAPPLKKRIIEISQEQKNEIHIENKINSEVKEDIQPRKHSISNLPNIAMVAATLSAATSSYHRENRNHATIAAKLAAATSPLVKERLSRPCSYSREKKRFCN